MIFVAFLALAGFAFMAGHETGVGEAPYIHPVHVSMGHEPKRLSHQPVHPPVRPAAPVPTLRAQPDYLPPSK